jgi:hypothetical protein
MGLWQRVAMDSLKFLLCPPCSTLLHPVGGPPLKRAYGCFSEVARPQGGWPVAIFYTFGYPMPYTYGGGSESEISELETGSEKWNHRRYDWNLGYEG